jgi:hypothetical protein
VPALTELPSTLEHRVLTVQRMRLSTPDGEGGFNISRERARDALAGGAD